MDLLYREKKNHILKLWNGLDKKNKHLLIKYLWKNNDNDTLKLDNIRILLGDIRSSEINNKRVIHASYANLLCIVLARTGEIKFMEDII